MGFDKIELNIGNKEMDLINEISGEPFKTHKFNFDNFIKGSLSYLSECEEEDEEPEMGEQFLKFLLKVVMIWEKYKTGQIKISFNEAYTTQIKIFEDIMNEGLEQYNDIDVTDAPKDLNSAILRWQRMMLGIEDNPKCDSTVALNGIELELEERISFIYDTKRDFEQLFNNLDKINCRIWKEFKEYLV
jgi:hypothetical protein